MSDRTRVGTLEERMDDVRAVLDAIGAPRYLHLMPGDEAEAAGLLDAYLDRAAS